MAEAYGGMKKWSEALALFDRTLDHIKKASEKLKRLTPSAQTDVSSSVSPSPIPSVTNCVRSGFVFGEFG